MKSSEKTFRLKLKMLVFEKQVEAIGETEVRYIRNFVQIQFVINGFRWAYKVWAQYQQ